MTISIVIKNNNKKVFLLKRSHDTFSLIHAIKSEKVEGQFVNTGLGQNSYSPRGKAW